MTRERAARVWSRIIVVMAIVAMMLLAGLSPKLRAQSPFSGKLHGQLVDSLCGRFASDTVLHSAITDTVYAWIRFQGRENADSVTWKSRPNEPIFFDRSYWFIRVDGRIEHIHQVRSKSCPVDQRA